MASKAGVSVRSFSTNLNAIWFTTWGITRLTLPGIIEEPGCIRSKIIPLNPRRGPPWKQTQIVANFWKFYNIQIWVSKVKHPQSHNFCLWLNILLLPFIGSIQHCKHKLIRKIFIFFWIKYEKWLFQIHYVIRFPIAAS